MEVAAFHPSSYDTRGLVSVALFVTSPCQGITLHPALRSPDFPPSCDGGCPADSRLQFYPPRRSLQTPCCVRRWTMKRRLYFLLPDVASATHTANDLLLARVEDRHMHFLARRGTDLGELHEASYLLKTDLMRGAAIGLVLGAFGGMILGYMIV